MDRMEMAQPGQGVRGRLLIGSDWVDAADGGSIAVIDPATEQEFARIAAATPDDVDRAVRAADRAFNQSTWRRMRPLDRGRLLENIALLVEKHADELAALECRDNGKPIWVCRNVDVKFTVDCFRYFAGWASKNAGEYLHLSPFIDDGGQYRAYTSREPVGVVAGITPWNFPMGQAAQKIAPALAFGCTIVLKPSEETSLTTLRLGELVLEAGVPPGVVNIVTGYGQTTGAALVRHDLVRKIAFTGSTRTGQTILGEAARQMKRVTLELGGKSPAIILADADLEQAIPGAAMAIFANSGQICTAGSRLFVERSIYDKVVEGVAAFGAQLKIGPGHLPDTQLGPLISSRQLQRVSGLVDSGRAQGATALSGGKRPDGAGYFYEPTVLVGAQSDFEVVREEVFGPVVVAMPLDDLGQVKTVANDTVYGLGASIWTRDLNKAHLLAEQIDAGTVWLNTHNMLDTAMPFGGVKLSGLGREFGTEAAAAYTETKAVCMRLSHPGL